MACIAMPVSRLAMTTTHFTLDLCRVEFALQQSKFDLASRTLRMNRVVVVDKDGNRRLNMNWAADWD
jgi:hypothetical protein